MANMVQVNSEVKVSKKLVEFYGETYIIIDARYMSELEFPTVELTTMDGDHCYLQPFRGYRMQISGSVDGEGDYGSSDVVGLGNIMCLTKDTNTEDSDFSIYSSWNGRGAIALQKEFLKLLVNQAMTNAMGGCRDWYVAMAKWKFAEVIDTFVNETAKYINNLRHTH